MGGWGLNIGGSSGKQKSTTESDLSQTGQRISNEYTSGWNTGQTRTSNWTPEQQRLASQLSGYLSGSWGGTNADKLAMSSLKRAASGEGYADIVNPEATDRLYAAVEKQTLEDLLPKSTNTIANQANLSGMLRSGQGLQMQLDNRNNIVNNLATQLAQMKYSDEQASRDIAREREARQIDAANSMIANNPTQRNIQNLLQYLGIRGATSESRQSQSQEQQQQDIAETLLKHLYEKTKGKTSGMNVGLGGSLTQFAG